MNSSNLLTNDIFSSNLNLSLIPILGEEDASLEIKPGSAKFSDRFNEDLSLIEQAIQAQQDLPVKLLLLPISIQSSVLMRTTFKLIISILTIHLSLHQQAN
jgi:hypothetical protein